MCVLVSMALWMIMDVSRYSCDDQHLYLEPSNWVKEYVVVISLSLEFPTRTYSFDLFLKT